MDKVSMLFIFSTSWWLQPDNSLNTFPVKPTPEYIHNYINIYLRCANIQKSH